MKHYRILLVDDSQNILKALKRSLSEEDFDIITCESALEAMALIEKEPFDICISDENMPGISGTDLLRAMQERFPEIIRIMLTGATDIEVAKNAINSGRIYRFFTKPWDDFELIYAIRQALKQRNMEHENKKLKAEVDRQNSLLQELEEEHPGITKKQLTEDGSIIINT